MIIPITCTFTFLLGLFFLILSFRVISLRRRKADSGTLDRAVRGHANFSEYTPLFMILMVLCEINITSTWILTTSGLLFSIGRLFHGFMFAFMNNHVMQIRVIGMMLTFAGLIMLLCNIGFMIVTSCIHTYWIA